MKYCLSTLPTLTLIYFVVNINKSTANTKTVCAIFLSRNEELYLPFFLSFFQRLTYPKDRISLYIRSGNNNDRTKEILIAWTKENFDKYHSVNLYLDDNNWNYRRLLEEALQEARNKDFDFFWLLNQRSVLTHSDVLQNMMEEDLLVVAPMMQSLSTYYSNFWGDMANDYSYARSSEYIDIVMRKKLGCFESALLQFLFLINLRNEKSKFLTFDKIKLENYAGPEDSTVVFSESARQNNIGLHICNKEEYGLFTSPYSNQSKDMEEIKRFLHQNKTSFNIPENILQFNSFPKRETFGLDKIYVINLARQPTRKQIMKERLREVGIEPTFFEAIDCESLNTSYLSSIGYRPHVNYTDNYLTTGGIGCGLSHYFLWEEAIKANYSKILILEDDAEFEEYFSEKLTAMLKEVEEVDLSWDLIYLCREKIYNFGDTPVKNTKLLVSVNGLNIRASGYMLSHSGLRKLHQQDFVSGMVPVDLYLSLKYWDVESRKTDPINGRINFSVDLNAFSIDPLIISHTQYGNRESDTEYSKQHHEEFGEFLHYDFKTVASNSHSEL